MTVGIISHPSCALHDAGAYHPERPERVLVIQEALQNTVFVPPLAFYTASLAPFEALKDAHDANYVDWIVDIAPKHSHVAIDADTLMNPHTLEAARYAAGAAILGVDLIMQAQIQAAFCNVRPPGHHAERDKAMGFCFFNNVAVGVRHLLKNYPLKRIAIIDFDVHHGNGTQDIFQDDVRVMYCSSFEHPFYPGYDAERDNAHMLGVPLRAGTTSEIFRELVAAAWFKKLEDFAPEFIFISAGFDAHRHDLLADLNLERDDYVWLMQEVKQIAKRHAQGRILMVLEGGYDLAVLADCVPACVMVMNEA